MRILKFTSRSCFSRHLTSFVTNTQFGYVGFPIHEILEVRTPGKQYSYDKIIQFYDISI